LLRRDVGSHELSESYNLKQAKHAWKVVYEVRDEYISTPCSNHVEIKYSSRNDTLRVVEGKRKPPTCHFDTLGVDGAVVEGQGTKKVPNVSK